MSAKPFEVRPPRDGEIVYRLIDTDTPTQADFLSDEQAGLAHNLPRSQSMALYRGFSVRETLEQARALALSLGKPHIAEVELSAADADSSPKPSSGEVGTIRSGRNPT